MHYILSHRQGADISSGGGFVSPSVARSRSVWERHMKGTTHIRHRHAQRTRAGIVH